MDKRIQEDMAFGSQLARINKNREELKMLDKEMKDLKDLECIDYNDPTFFTNQIEDLLQQYGLPQKQ